MAIELKEDQTAPITRRDISDASSEAKWREIVRVILSGLNEKRDAYNGIVSSIIYCIESHNENLIKILRDSLIDTFTCNPIKFGGKMFIRKALCRLTSEKPEFIVDLFEKVIDTTNDWSKNYEHQSEILKIQITSLKAIRRAEQEKGINMTRLTSEQVDQLCSQAVRICDDSTKIDTLSLILESKVTTKPVTEKELKYFEVLFQDALSLQEPANRQIFMSITKKLIRRIKDSHRVVMRDKKKYEEQERQSIHHRYVGFLEWLIDFCFDSIYCNAYFGSFILTISTLKLIVQHITFDDEDLPIKQLFCQRRCYDSLLSCLSDSFEENKSIALGLLLSLPRNEELLSEDSLQNFERMAYELVSSVNPAHSLTCQYVFKLIIGLRINQDSSIHSKNKLLYYHLSKLMDLVESGIHDTQENFIVALKHNAIYPKLTCIRALLNEVDTNKLEEDRERWSKLAKRIVKNSIDACQVVSAVVCNLNPETIGHLPMDLKPVDVATLAKTLNVSMKISNDQLSTITSQMLLISGWKTIKECSLSMGAMCCRLWWPSQTKGLKEPILESDDIVKIIDFFDHYLRNLRHRGAFEQAYNGFLMVTRQIWQEECYQDLLTKALHEIMNDFKSNDSSNDNKRVECLKAYITRRSAGLPFIIQAILNSEHKHNSNALRFVMDSLFEVLDSPDSETYKKIHCLNILKAIIKEHFLGEKVTSYLDKTFAITLDSFRSDSFSIRNCANMLLKATVDRTFGVNRLKVDIHRQNQLSFEKFFTECPSLYEKMLKHLRDGVEDRKCLAAVHGVLLILFRLKPSLHPSEEYSCDKIIKPFLEPIMDLVFTCPDFKLREVAAKLAVLLDSYCQVVDDSNSSDRLEQLKYIIYHESSENDRNRLHGALLLTNNWIGRFDLDKPEHANFHLFAQGAIREIMVFVRTDVNCCIKMSALDIAESGCLTSFTYNVKLLDLYPWYCTLLKKKIGFEEPHYESLVFRFTSLLLMSALFLSARDETCAELSSSILSEILQTMSAIISQEPDRTYSMNIQSSFIRLLRQLLNESSSIVDKLLDNLDLDLTAAHLTPFDKLKTKVENDLEREKWSRYCNHEEYKHLLRKHSTELSNVFLFKNYSEFHSCPGEELCFNSRKCNTPRCIELLAFALENWDEFGLEHNIIWQRNDESSADKLRFLTKFISDLPDCDVKCLALLCAGNLVVSHLRELPKSTNKFDQECLNNFSELLDELADGNHSYTIRETCSEVLQICLCDVVNRKCEPLQTCLTYLLSTLIKLSQDEEHQIRLCSSKVILDICSDCETNDPGGNIRNLIALITTEIYDPDLAADLDNCFSLLMHIIFNHAKNYSTDLTEERERLFDKTKLNTFADHVATIRSCLEGLRKFISRRSGSKEIDLNLLPLSEHIIEEITIIDAPIEENIGDYSWRTRKLISQCSIKSELSEDSIPSTTDVDNNKIVDRALQSILMSLQYFRDGYNNVLMDTEYTFHELSLFKRVAFISFILKCTNFNPENSNLVQKIGNTLHEIVTHSCSTTLLCKCLDLMDS